MRLAQRFDETEISPWECQDDVRSLLKPRSRGEALAFAIVIALAGVITLPLFGPSVVIIYFFLLPYYLAVAVLGTDERR